MNHCYQLQKNAENKGLVNEVIKKGHSCVHLATDELNLLFRLHIIHWEHY